MEKIEIILYALSNLYDIISIKIKKEICQKNAYIYNIGGLFYDGFQESF